MSSNSIRISAGLFEHAQQRGSLLSRSAAQQVEHWARLGAAVEDSGLTVTQLVELLSGATAQPQTTERSLRGDKRAQQARDIAAIESGRASNESMSWFSGGRARRAKAIDSPL